jgi:SSS family solute:Na+ symporter
MNSGFETIDYVVFIIYGVVILGAGLWISRPKKGVEKTSQDYFLADRSLSWWAIGASLIAANISAEQFIAMSGSGFRLGLGIAAYEWIGAIALIIVGKWLLPVFLENKIYTMPQFLEKRFNKGVSTAFAIFWLLVYVFVNLTTVIWLGALAMNQIMGISIMWSILGLASFAGIYSIYGGLKAVAWTDVIQVIFLIGGGLVTSALALDFVSGGEGIFSGLQVLYEKASDHFVMIVPRGSMVSDGSGGLKDAFDDLPGLAIIFGGMWLTNIGYWGFNQYIIQKGLAAKNLEHAKNGLIFAGYLKILIPIIVVIPGIAAYVLYQDPEIIANMNLSSEITKADDAYPWLLRNIVPAGVRGISFAALIAAIVSSLASMINSTSTIFTMDIYKQYINKNSTDKQEVFVGRVVAFVALFLAVITARPLLGGLDQAFQYIQEYTGYIYPGVVLVFIMGLFWKKATAKAALWTAIITIPLGIVIKWIVPDMPFILRMGYVFIILVFVASIISFLDKKNDIANLITESKYTRSAVRSGWILITFGVISLIAGILLFKPLYYLGIESIFMMATALSFLGMILILNVKMKVKDADSISSDPEIFKTNSVFNIGALGILGIIMALYILFW